MQHKNIPDSELHEVKGAANTTDTQAALFSDGVGGTTFRKITYADLSGAPSVTVGTDVAITASSTVNQIPPTGNTNYVVTFGAASVTSLINLSATGEITFLSSGTYIIEVDLNCGRWANGTGTFLCIAEKLNGVQIGDHMNRVRLEGTVKNTQTQTISLRTTINVQFNDIYTVNLVKHNADSIGLISSTLPVITGWPSTMPSASLRILSFIGD